MGAGVGLAVPALALDGLLCLAAAARVAVVGDKAGLCALFFSGHKNSFPTRLPMHMRYGILDASAGRESLTVLFFSDMHPMRARQLLSYKAAGILFAQTPPLVETLAGASGYVSALRRSAGLMCRMSQSAKRLSILGWPAPRS